MRGAADHVRRLRGVDVRILEQAELELFGEQARGGLVDAALRHEAGLDEVGDGGVRAEPGQHVDAAVDGGGDALRDRPLLEAPGAVVDDAGVGVDVAREAEPRAQQVGDDRAREREPGLLEPHALVRHVHRDAVVRHHRRHAGVDRGDERLHVIGEAAARVDLALAERVVRVQPQLLRPAAGKVLDGERDRRRRTHRPALQAGARARA